MREAASTVCLLHGFLGDPTEWDAVISECVQLKTRATNPPTSASFQPLPLPPASDWDAAIATLDQQLADKCVLVGYSMGGRLALGCVMSNPTKYSGLVLLSANPGLTGESERRARADSDQQLAERLLSKPLTRFLTDWYEQPLFAPAPIEMRQRWVEERRGLDRDYQAGLVSQLSVGRQPDFWPRLPDLKLPTLFIVGEHDAKYAAIAAEAHRRNTNFRVQTIPNAGHAVHREAPACVSRHLIEFLAGVQTS